jgi:hypothetical protein
LTALLLAFVLAAFAVAPARAQFLTDAPGSYPKRQVLHDIGGTVRGIVVDFGYVVSSPARMSARDVVLTAAVAGATWALYNNDQAILDQFQRNRGNPVYDAILEPGRHLESVGLMGRTNPYYFGALVIGYATDIRPLREIPAEILESHAIAGGIRNGFKTLVGRHHPEDGKGPYAFDPPHGTSFPSGHSSVDFELATILSHHTRWVPLKVVWYGLATSAVLQRIDARAHWPSDVLPAAIAGHLIARTVCERHDQRLGEGHRMLGFAPIPGGAALTFAF